MIRDTRFHQNKSTPLRTRRDSDFTLADHVRIAVENYFDQLDGHPARGLYHLVLTQIEKPLVETVLDRCRQNQTKAANALGISRSTLRKKITEYDID